MEQCGSDVRGIEPFFQQDFDQGIVALIFPGAQSGADHFEQCIRTSLLYFRNGWDFGPLNPRPGVTLDLLNLKKFPPRDERDGPAASPCPSGSADPVDI